MNDSPGRDNTSMAILFLLFLRSQKIGESDARCCPASEKEGGEHASGVSPAEEIAVHAFWACFSPKHNFARRSVRELSLVRYPDIIVPEVREMQVGIHLDILIPGHH